MSTSCGSSGMPSAAQRAADKCFGIPYRCQCGSSVSAFTSKSGTNPYRRFFRCGHAAALKLHNDFHVFKWVEDALTEEIEALNEKQKHLEETMKTMSAYMEDAESIARMKVENEVCEKFEKLVDDANRRVKNGIVGGIC